MKQPDGFCFFQANADRLFQIGCCQYCWFLNWWRPCFQYSSRAAQLLRNLHIGITRSLVLLNKYSSSRHARFALQEQHGRHFIKLAHFLKQGMRLAGMLWIQSIWKVYRWDGATLCSKPAAIALTLIPICEPIDSSGVKLLLP